MDRKDFNPPLLLRGRPAEPVRTLEEAAKFLQTCDDRRGRNRASLLRALQVVKSEQDRYEAVKAFRAWIEAEGLLLIPSSHKRDRNR